MSAKPSFKHKKSENPRDADALGSLYADHEIKAEVVIGPVEIRRRVVNFKLTGQNGLANVKQEQAKPVKIALTPVCVNRELKREAEKTNIVQTKWEAEMPTSNREPKNEGNVPASHGEHKKENMLASHVDYKRAAMTVFDEAVKKDLLKCEADDCKPNAPIKDPVLPNNFSHPCKICRTEDIKHYTCSEMAVLGHLRKHKRPPATCHVCKQTFQYEHKLKKHMIRHSKERTFTCKICHKAYKHMSSLSVHKCTKPNEKPFKCQHCPKSFSFKGQLQTHIRSHTGEKPYKCNICSKEFTQQTSLNNHVLKHKGIKPHRCEFCKESFRQVSNLKKHLEVKHSDKKVESHQKTRKCSSISLVWYSCKKCRVVLSGVDKMYKHMKTCN